MVRLSRFHRLALLASSTAVVTAGVLSQGSAFAATQWQEITDSPSGITVRLPGKPVVQRYSDHGVNSRNYVVPTRYGALGFSVFDGPAHAQAKPWDLKTGLKAAVDGYNSADTGAGLRSTGVHEGTKDGDRYLEAKLVGAGGRTGHIRLVDHGRQSIVVMTVGHDDQRATVDRDYRQVLDSVKVPDHAPRQVAGPAVAT
ncbi:hypothetical protein ACIBJF_33335 [Streptomyces sp. NPDC050743]|uniref:hypothetical protein n=1 Tax=Streptomyces sp. NPDC050743 TaxID=3365634 RepID=UPI0037A63CB7